MSESSTTTPSAEDWASHISSLVVGIPQGCPLSMTFIAFLFHPWALKMRSLQVVPRGLADDLTIYAIGEFHEHDFKSGYIETLNFLKLIGAKPAPTTCYAFSTHPLTRFRLAQEYWEALGARIKVIQSVRDLGGRLYTTRINGATLTA